MAQWTTEEVQDTVRKIVARATVDSDFRAHALKDTQAAFAKFDPRPLPAGFKLKFYDNSLPEMIVPFPPMVEGVQELDEADLEQVAGGNDVAVGVTVRVCWVAAELYGGWSNPRVSLIRNWLLGEFSESFTGRALVAVYARFGERIARAMRHNALLRKSMQFIFDKALRRAQA
jgi:hypothetical protein